MFPVSIKYISPFFTRKYYHKNIIYHNEYFNMIIIVPLLLYSRDNNLKLDPISLRAIT